MVLLQSLELVAGLIPFSFRFLRVFPFSGQRRLAFRQVIEEALYRPTGSGEIIAPPHLFRAPFPANLHLLGVGAREQPLFDILSLEKKALRSGGRKNEFSGKPLAGYSKQTVSSTSVLASRSIFPQSGCFPTRETEEGAWGD